ncbi:MAG TPA: OB-fold nucleic acid binding domain-containing protein [Bacteroidales bacterium]|nr:OB-fold nucleic acid binding domain-containing protein [Bacteroidales bacterium]HPT08801.1 OB-fold nucleic acid binding domain-containing protein [Bacteroidales bacterium]
MKHSMYLLLFPVVLAFSACNSSTDKNLNAKADTTRISVLTFTRQADSLVNKPVMIEGTVFHTCKHGGKRLFLVDGTDSIRVEVTAGEQIAKFDESLIGSRILITGLLREERIDTKYLNEWEAEVKKPEENHGAGLHTGAKGHEDQGVQEKLDQIAALRADLKNSGKDHLSFFSVEAISYKVIQ